MWKDQTNMDTYSKAILLIAVRIWTVTVLRWKKISITKRWLWITTLASCKREIQRKILLVEPLDQDPTVTSESKKDPGETTKKRGRCGPHDKPSTWLQLISHATSHHSRANPSTPTHQLPRGYLLPLPFTSSGSVRGTVAWWAAEASRRVGRRWARRGDDLLVWCL